MKLLVLTSEPITAEQLKDALPDGVDPKEAQVMVVAPALQQSGLKFWLSDADEAIARAEQVRAETLERLGSEGIAASGDTGESDPVQAIEDALTTFPADRILVFTHADAYREDFDAEELRERFGIPVDRA
jgi:broad specificity polyphosphatase/5'/3'-nucleotidase SurE